MLNITKKCAAEILAHAQAAAPEECCGFLIQEGRTQVYLPVSNAAAEKTETFAIDAEDFVNAQERGEILAVVHSHPSGELFLSGADRQMQNQLRLPFVLAVSGSLKVFRPVPLLRGRPFEYGVADCAALVRDAFHLAGVDLDDHERTDLETDAERGELLAHGLAQGFVQVDADGIRVGDVLLTGTDGRPEHAALYIGDNEMLHHAFDTLSRREPYNDFWRRRTLAVLRHPKWQPEMLQALTNDLQAGLAR